MCPIYFFCFLRFLRTPKKNFCEENGHTIVSTGLKIIIVYRVRKTTKRKPETTTQVIPGKITL